MALKRWILHTVNRMNGAARPDLQGESASAPAAPAGRSPAKARGHYDARDGGALQPDQLGAYAPLVTAIRDELIHFATTQLRLHLAIAERDRYLLTCVEVECVDGSEGAGLLDRFTHEFTPEQIKRFIARGVIAQLPNAAAIDLSQFGGLNAPPEASADSGGDDDYAELIEQLRAAVPAQGPRSFEVRLLGRWTEGEAAEPRAPAEPARGAARTPLAGASMELEIEDAGGERMLTLPAVVPGRRYVVGKGEGCDVRVEGGFTSRRHCELWLEDGAWWTADAGSTNGLRLETAQGVTERRGGQGATGERKAPLRVPAGAKIVLSALASGSAADYPRLLLRQGGAPATAATPIAPAARAVPTTPMTPIAAARPRGAPLEVTATMSSGVRCVELTERGRPLRVGRSRNQDLVVDWAHEGVSGRHVEISLVDESGADVEVHGDNGVSVAGVVHEPGQRFRWRPGETMILGRASGGEPQCTLVLAVQRDPGVQR